MTSNGHTNGHSSSTRKLRTYDNGHTNGDSSSTQIGKVGEVELNEVLWATEENENNDGLVKDVLWNADHTDNKPTKIEEEPEKKSPNFTINDELLETGEENIEETETQNKESTSNIETKQAELAEEVAREVVNDDTKINDSVCHDSCEGSNEHGEIDSDYVETIDPEVHGFTEEPVFTRYVSSRPALRSESPFQVQSEPNSPNPAAFPRLRKANAMPSLVMSPAPAKRSHDDSSSSASSDSAAKRLRRNWLPAGLTRWWSGPEAQTDEEKQNAQNCSLM